ncbi:Ig-like domain-containing protein, partial [Sulfitobacter sp.]|uniref:Ig-like domain-containing protein n=1 Tax=Sulfitobacter sp. TaxID=1903071 RepID=UPI0035695904
TQDSLSFIDQNGISGSYDALTGVLTLSGTATLAQYQTAMTGVTYANSSDDPDTTDREISFAVNDGDADSAIATSTVTVEAVNDGPTVLGATSVGATTVNTIQDYNAPNSAGNGGFNSAYNGLPGGQVDGRAISGFAAGDQVTFTISGANFYFKLSDSEGNLLAPFDGLFSNQLPGGTFTGTYTVQGGADTYLRWDLTGNSQTGGNPSYSVAATAETGGLIVDEDTSASFSDLSVLDPDAGAGDIAVDLGVDHGALSLGTSAGLTLTDGDGSDGTLAFTGTVADVNAALAALDYTGDQDFNGEDRLNISIDDQGNSGTGGAQSASASVVIDVAAVNDAPVFDAPGAPTSFTVVEDEAVQIQGLSFFDAEWTGVGTTYEMSAVIAVDHGTLNFFGDISGLVVAGNNGESSVTLQGDLLAVNQALGSLMYVPDADFNGADEIRVEVSDLGQTGTGGV